MTRPLRGPAIVALAVSLAVLGLAIAPALVVLGYGPIRSLTIDRGVPPAEAARISLTFEQDIASVERTLGARFTDRPAVRVYASDRDFAHAASLVFADGPSVAGSLAANHSGVYDPLHNTIAINWPVARRSSGVLRHELGHALLRAVGGRDLRIPAWLDEGLAVLAERAGAPADGAAASTARSLLGTGGLDLESLASTTTWLADDPERSSYAYALAGEAARAVLTDRPVTLGQLLLRASQPGLAMRVRAGLLRHAPLSGLVAGDGRWSAFGLPTAAAVKFGITPAGSAAGPSYQVSTGPLGTYAGVLPDLVPGVYLLTVSAASGTVGAVLTVPDPSSSH